METPDVRRIIEATIEELGSRATPELVKKVVARILDSDSTNPTKTLDKEEKANFSHRIMITASGPDNPENFAAITHFLEREGVQILELTRRTSNGSLGLIIQADCSLSKTPCATLQDRLQDQFQQLGFQASFTS